MQEEENNQIKKDFEDFISTKNEDPFPEIPPALLNSAHIRKYAEKIEMIRPFELDDLKSATYQGRIGGQCIYWDGDGNKVDIALKKGESLQLRPNSITFVGINLDFRMPSYMVARFNLRVTNAYKGLLLGTGPIIDPGFYGRIYIPLHNLTTNSYVLLFNDVLIQIEFTKSSPIIDDKNSKLLEEYIEYESQFPSLGLQSYLNRARKDHPTIRSSIPKALSESESIARRAAENAKSSKNWSRGLTILGIIGYIAAFFIFIIEIKKDHETIMELSSDNRIKELEIKDAEHRGEILKILEGKIKNLEKRLDEDSNDLDTQKNSGDNKS